MTPTYCAPLSAPVSTALDGCGKPIAPVPDPRNGSNGALALPVVLVVPLPVRLPLLSTRSPVGPIPTIAPGVTVSSLPGSVIVSGLGTLTVLPKKVGEHAPEVDVRAGGSFGRSS